MPEAIKVGDRIKLTSLRPMDIRAGLELFSEYRVDNLVYADPSNKVESGISGVLVTTPRDTFWFLTIYQYVKVNEMEGSLLQTAVYTEMLEFYRAEQEQGYNSFSAYLNTIDYIRVRYDMWNLERKEALDVMQRLLTLAKEEE